MTPREPDRFDAQGDELAAAFQTVRCPDRRTLACQIAAALRALGTETLERAAEWIRDNAHRLLSGDELAEAILKLKSPAAEAWICPKDLQEDCSAPDGEIARCTDRACPMKSPAATPERRASAESCRCPATWEDEDVTYRCSFTRNHPGPHNDNGMAEWVGETHHAAAPAAETDAPNGPVCGCGRPSRYESGWCGETSCFANVATPSEPAAPAPPQMDEDGCCVVCGRGLEPCYACGPAPAQGADPAGRAAGADGSA